MSFWSIFCTLLCSVLTCENVVSDFPFRNVSLGWNARVDDLVYRLTLDEVVQQLSKGGANSAGPAPAIPRLGIKPYQWNTECLRGEPQSGNATAFPQALNLASTWNDDLVKRVSVATSVEVRAKNNNYTKHGVYKDHTGLSCFSPVINIMRHPLWGRNQETYGEDPYLSGILATNFVQGLHGNNKRYVRTSSGCKHFDVHAGPEKHRLSFNAVVSERDWALTFQPAFKTCVQAGTYSVMCSYNSINGVPACINKKLLTNILREKWGFKGYVVSDETAIENIMLFHKYLEDPTEVAARCLEAGTNLELSSGVGPITYEFLQNAVDSGRLKSELLYERVKPLFYTRMRLGEFDPPEMNPYTRLNLTWVLSPKHQMLAREAASQSFVMLKNQDDFLPLNGDKIPNLAIVGPMANNTVQIMGDYAPQPDLKFVSTPLRGLSKLASHVTYASGCQDGTPCMFYDSDQIQKAVVNASVTVVCLGTGQIIEAEAIDRTSLSLPGYQKQLLLDVINRSRGPILLLLFSTGPLDIGPFYDSNKVKAIFQCGFSAQATGLALYDVLLNNGPNGNPAGRLPYTWYRSLSQVADIRNYTMSERTYRYFTGEPLFPFGYGLSYTKFVYTKLALSHSLLKIGQDLQVRVKVGNSGHLAGDEVVQVYLNWADYRHLKMPQLQLVGFKRVRIPRGEICVSFVVKSEQMAVWINGEFVVVPGRMTIYVGGQQPNQRVSVGSNVLQADFTITRNRDFHTVRGDRGDTELSDRDRL